jgi:hypothetical protein
LSSLLAVPKELGRAPSVRADVPDDCCPVNDHIDRFAFAHSIYGLASLSIEAPDYPDLSQIIVFDSWNDDVGSVLAELANHYRSKESGASGNNDPLVPPELKSVNRIHVSAAWS